MHYLKGTERSNPSDVLCHLNLCFYSSSNSWFGMGGMADVATMKERRIVVAVDESDESIYALRWCLGNLLHHAGEETTVRNTLILLYAKPLPSVHSLLDGPGYLFSDEVIASMDKYSKVLADSIIQRAKNICLDYSNIKVEAKVSAGDARDVICETVQKLGAELLVMGSHGYGFIKRTLLGSVSDYCARNAKCPVLIVKRAAN
ncbi:universal stress protein A-like protein [Elaeis guineensis]|uniref:universal stress protein A-like protein n=1 Tax=Elaeis guineensis var. tenera TaxID=51953 RepID=UPI003C6CF6E7